MQVTKFFQKSGVDVCSPKSMFNFINEHFRYYTMNSWNGHKSIANNVKVYNLGLSSDPYVTLRYLEAEEYFTVNDMINDWEREHTGYSIGFNGRSGGYLVLYSDGDVKSVVPEELEGYDCYEDWKADILANGECVSDYLYRLRDVTNLIRDFDKLCDEIRAYVEELGNGRFEIDQMENDVTTFNDLYANDLDFLDFSPLEMDADGKVDISEINQLTCLFNAFLELTNSHKAQGYVCKVDKKNEIAYLAEDY